MFDASSADSRARLLLVSCDLAHACLIQEAFTELGENFRGPTGPRANDLTMVDVLEDALELINLPGDPARAGVTSLPTPSFDALLLDPQLPDCSGLACLSRIRAVAPDLPVIVLVSRKEECLGITFVREGAQDYLIKEDVDCDPLQRSIRFATERARLARLIRESAILDSATGCHSPAGFRILAEHDWRLAVRLRLPFVLHLVRARNEENEQICLLAGALRRCIPKVDVIGRLDTRTFAAVALGASAAEPFTLPGLAEVTTVCCRFDAGECVPLADLLEAARNQVCENGQIGRDGPAFAFYATP